MSTSSQYMDEASQLRERHLEAMKVPPPNDVTVDSLPRLTWVRLIFSIKILFLFYFYTFTV